MEQACFAAGPFHDVQAQFDQIPGVKKTTHDPTQLDHQGDASGEQFRSVIFYVNEEQRDEAEKVLNNARPNYEAPIVTAIEPLGPFYQA